MKNKTLMVPRVLKAMKEYFYNQDKKLHTELNMAYCKTCQNIVPVGGDYTVHAGFSCGGDNYKVMRAKEKCGVCSSERFIKIFLDDMSELREVYGDKTSELLIQAIAGGLKELDFPDLYNKELPAVAEKWNKLNKKTQINQVNQLFEVQNRLLCARQKVIRLEKEVLIR